MTVVLILWGCSAKPKPQIAPKGPAVKVQDEKPTSAPPAELQPPPTKQPELNIPLAEKRAAAEEPPVEKTPVVENVDTASLMEEALALCQEAQASWELGDLDRAVAALDDAYALLLRISPPLDSPLADEKNDLRLNIAKRIQTIHAARQQPGRENNKTIPLVENRYVLAEIESFKNRERKYFEEAYMRSGLYREMIQEELRKAGLPEDLSWLPIIESGFKIRALSRARALGLWQFIASTGSLYDLKRDRWVDERMDPVKATRAAIRYLSDLHAMFGDWTTALAGYNCGEYRVQRVINAQRINYLDNFWDLFAMLPYETARFVPRFIAALSIIKDPAKYGFVLPRPYPPLKFETTTVSQAVKLSVLSSALGLDASELAFLNPDLRYDATPEYAYELRIPPGLGERAREAVLGLPRWIPPEAMTSLYTVRRGDTLSSIARKHRTSVAALKRLNNIKGTLIHPGQRLKVPARGGSYNASAEE
ncbi:MAG: hypothetical protein A2Y86_07370 [Candidatus Aminicenantes bacterium RBG_13_62_12]|nr:MAG: hypothetical protein A2Y86_07370 [Candidatus Aminicenantes bacterium RBG_13_62_12]